MDSESGVPTVIEQKSEQNPYGTLPRILSDFCSSTAPLILYCSRDFHIGVLPLNLLEEYVKFHDQLSTSISV